MSIGKAIKALGFGIAALGLSLTGAAAQTLKIGIITPLTGPGAQWGMAGKMAGEILAREVNAKGGLEVAGKKYQVQFIAYDDQYKAAEAVAAYNRLVTQDGVKYLMVATSAPTMAIRQSIEDDKIIALTSSYTEAAITKDSKYMFRLYSTSADFLPAYIGWMKDNIKERRLVTLNPNDESGWSQKNVTEKHFKDNGFNIVAGELYERSLQNFAPIVTRILDAKPDIMDVGSSSPATAGLIVRQARELGFKGRFVQTGGAGWAAIVQAAGKEAAEGLVNVLYANPEDAGYRRLVEEYKKTVGQEPNEIIVPYYDAFTALLAAIQKGGDVNDTTKTAAAFKSVLPMKGLQGDEMTWEHQQIRTFNYVGVLTDGKPRVGGRIK
jgi:branched-chain amino acid transport system substrate-binding protein